LKHIEDFQTHSNIRMSEKYIDRVLDSTIAYNQKMGNVSLGG